MYITKDPQVVYGGFGAMISGEKRFTIPAGTAIYYLLVAAPGRTMVGRLAGPVAVRARIHAYAAPGCVLGEDLRGISPLSPFYIMGRSVPVAPTDTRGIALRAGTRIQADWC